MAAVELRSLRISPELDTSKYVVGAQQVDAADKMMIAGKKATGAAFSATDAKISQSGDVLARLSRQYVDGYASAQRMQSAVNSLSRGVENGKITIAQAIPILEGIHRKYGQIGDGAQFAAKGQNEFAAAITATNAKLAAQAAVADAASASVTRIRPAANQNVAPSVSTSNQFNTANIAAQFQDIGVTSAMGMSPLQIALQQGTQLQAILGPMGAAGAAKALGAAFMSLINPVSLVTLALVGGTAAAIQYFMKGREGTKTLDDALKAHEAQVKRIEEGWGKATAAEQRYGKQSASAAGFGLEMTTADLRAQLRKQIPDVLSAITTATSDNISDIGGARSFRGTALFTLLSGEIEDLVKKAKIGEPDIIGLTRRIEELGAASDNNGIKALARDVADAIRPVEDLARNLVEANNQLKKFREAVGPHGLPLRRGILSTEDMGALDLFNAAEQVSADRRRQAAAAQLQAIYARSPEERAAAARASAAAQYNDESAPARSDRIEIAGKLALAEANHAIAQAQNDRARSLEATLASQQLDLALIGQTTGEAAQMRFEFERVQALREEAARNGVAVDEQELALIKAKAIEYGKYADAIARATLNRDLDFERSQLFLSPGERAIASRLRGTGIGLNSPFAQQMRDNQTFADMKGLASGFLNDFKSGLVSSGGDIGEALGNAIQNALLKSMDMYLSDVFDHLATMFARSMTGQAAPFGTPDGFAKMLGIGIKGSSSDGVLGSANDNLDIAGYIRQAAVARGIDPNIALRVARSEGLAPGIWQSNVIRNGIREPSYGPFQLLKGGAGTGFPSGLGNAFQSATGLDPANPANVRPGIDFALNHAAGNGWGAWYGAKAAGVGNWEGLQGASTKAVGSLDRLATSSIDTANDLRSGLGNLGNALNQFPSAPGGGGLLGNLLGGLNSAFSGSRAFNWLSSNPGSFINFYADGTEDAPPGWAWVGERGPELMRMRGGETIRSSQRSAEMISNQNRSQAPATEINIINQDGAQVKSTKKRKNASGGDVTDIVIGVVKQSIADGDLDGAFGGRFGAQPVRARRGSL